MRKVMMAVFTTLGLSLPALAGTLTLSYTGNLRTDATFTGCGFGCTLGPSDSDGTWAQFAAVTESFHVGSASSMTAISFSYGGGANGAGTPVAQGGFEPYLSLFDAAGNFMASTAAGTYCPPGSSFYQGQCYDVSLDGGTLAPGTYQIAISDWANASYAENNGPPAVLADGFTGLGNLATGEDLHFAFDVILSNNDTPEPATFGLIGVALGLLGLIRRPR